jgi:hypothetical protein
MSNKTNVPSLDSGGSRLAAQARSLSLEFIQSQRSEEGERKMKDEGSGR